MTADLHYLAGAALLTWVMLLFASLMRARAWTPQGLKLALGNRESMREPSPIAARADRAAKNMLENLVLFAVVVLVARLGGVEPARVVPGAAIFFWARVAYFLVYLAGVPVLRTLIWAVSVVGLAMIVIGPH
jgi:uncharacterized MAPEG superfamily protein